MTGGGSFEEFYTGAVSRLLGQLFLVTGDLHEAEEVVQEAFARASVRWSWLRDYNAPEACFLQRHPNRSPTREPVDRSRTHVNVERTGRVDALRVIDSSAWPRSGGPAVRAACGGCPNLRW